MLGFIQLYMHVFMVDYAHTYILCMCIHKQSLCVEQDDWISVSEVNHGAQLPTKLTRGVASLYVWKSKFCVHLQ